MKVKMQAEKLQSFTLNGETIRASELPEALRNEVDTLNRLSQDRLDKIYEMEIIELALSTKKIQVMTAVRDYYSTKAEAGKPNEIIHGMNELESKVEKNEVSND